MIGQLSDKLIAQVIELDGYKLLSSEVCKTFIRRFDPAPRLQLFRKLFKSM